MTPFDPNKEKLKKQSTPTEAVDHLISKKEAERHADGMSKVMEQAAGVQSEVADVMAGMESASDRISEKQGETGEKGDIGGGSSTTTQSDDDQIAAQIRTGLARRGLPTQIVMIKKIRTAINLQIKDEMKKAAVLKKSLTTGGAQEYNATIARIRGLQQLLKSLFHTTLERVKEVYFKYFKDDGRRRASEEL